MKLPFSRRERGKSAGIIKKADMILHAKFELYHTPIHIDVKDSDCCMDEQ